MSSLAQDAGLFETSHRHNYKPLGGSVVRWDAAMKFFRGVGALPWGMGLQGFYLILPGIFQGVYIHISYKYINYSLFDIAL